jgi:dolichyl-diphosphooligosaccharide--protein glycosyltransferase
MKGLDGWVEMSPRISAWTSLREELGREKLGERLNALKDWFTSMPRAPTLEYILLGLIVALAATLRILPLRWGMFLSEFDPYQQYRMADHIINHGFSSWFTWHDYMSWHPWGRDIPTTNYPGIAFTAAITYRLLRILGVELTLLQWCILFPVVFGSLTCVAAYLLGKEVGGGGVGLFSALLLAFSSSHINRTSLGFFDDETLSIFLMLLFFTFFLKASSEEAPIRVAVNYSLLAGLSMAYLAASWGAFRYPLSLVALYSLVIVFLRKGGRNLVLTYGISLGIALMAMLQIPRLGYAFLKEWTTLALIGVFAVLVISEFSKIVKTELGKASLIASIAAVLAAASYLLFRMGVISSLAGKFSAVLNPGIRAAMPLVESVAEHRPGTWASIFYEFGALIFLGIFGFYFLARKGRPKDVFLILFGITSAYFASSFVRLTLLMSPAFVILSAVAVNELAKPSLDILKEKVILPKRKAVMRVGKEYGVASLMIILIALMPTFYYATRSAYSPTTIATSSIPVAPSGDEIVKYQDWLHALLWMRNNLPEDAVVMSWWDYGYWITAIADKRSLADNGTINATQIAIIACTFLSNETWAIPVMKRYNVTHVAVFVTWTRDEKGGIRYYGYGEDNKWYWMAKIGNGTSIDGLTFNFYQRRLEDEVRFIRIVSSGGKMIANDTIAGKSGIAGTTILGKMIMMGISPGSVESDYLENVFTSANRFVLVYKVLYLKSADLTLELSPRSISYGESVAASGRLTSPEGEPIPEKEIIIESLRQEGTTWEEITRVKTSRNGTYLVTWNPQAGNYTIRARWPGEKGVYKESTSPPQELTVGKLSARVTCELSNSTITLGDEVKVKASLSVPTSEGNITLEYKVEGGEWTPIKVGLLENGTYITTWRPDITGKIQVRAIWSGGLNYNPATSDPAVLEVKPRESR